jgi:hypothetical protein
MVTAVTIQDDPGLDNQDNDLQEIKETQNNRQRADIDMHRRPRPREAATNHDTPSGELHLHLCVRPHRQRAPGRARPAGCRAVAVVAHRRQAALRRLD